MSERVTRAPANVSMMFRAVTGLVFVMALAAPGPCFVIPAPGTGGTGAAWYVDRSRLNIDGEQATYTSGRVCLKG